MIAADSLVFTEQENGSLTVSQRPSALKTVDFKIVILERQNKRKKTIPLSHASFRVI